MMASKSLLDLCAEVCNSIGIITRSRSRSSLSLSHFLFKMKKVHYYKHVTSLKFKACKAMADDGDNRVSSLPKLLEYCDRVASDGVEGDTDIDVFWNNPENLEQIAAVTTAPAIWSSILVHANISIRRRAADINDYGGDVITDEEVKYDMLLKELCVQYMTALCMRGIDGGDARQFHSTNHVLSTIQTFIDRVKSRRGDVVAEYIVECCLIAGVPVSLRQVLMCQASEDLARDARDNVSLAAVLGDIESVRKNMMAEMRQRDKGSGTFHREISKAIQCGDMDMFKLLLTTNVGRLRDESYALVRTGDGGGDDDV